MYSYQTNRSLPIDQEQKKTNASTAPQSPLVQRVLMMQQTLGNRATHQLMKAHMGATRAGGGVVQRMPKNNNEEDKKKRRSQFLTRIIRVDQLNRRNIGTNSVRSSDRSLNRNLVPRFTANGKGKTKMSRLYSYMRKYGGAGYQGFHREPPNMKRSQVVRPILNKMNQDPGRITKSSRGKKFAMIVTHPDKIGRDKVLDLRKKSVRTQFEQNYKKYSNMYKNHRKEGVVAVDGHIDLQQILALRAFRGVPSQEELDEIIDGLLDAAEQKMDAEEEDDLGEDNLDEEPTYSLEKGNKFDEDEDPFGPGSGGNRRTVSTF